jgi:hypothetical protein
MYGPGSHNIGPVELACNWQTDLYVGEVQTDLLPGIGHTQLLAFDYEQNQNCNPPDFPIKTGLYDKDAVVWYGLNYYVI